MSTKIHSGFSLPNIKTLPQLQSWISDVREQGKAVQREIFLQRLAIEITYILDTYFRNQFDLPTQTQKFDNHFHEEGDSRGETYLVSSTPWSLACRHIRKQISVAEKSPYSYDGFHVGYEVCLFLIGDKVLGMPFGEAREYDAMLSAMDDYAYYGYWDNSDEDESCTEEEWNQRRDDWNIALPGIGIPNENGMTVQVVPQKMDIALMYDRADFYQEILDRISPRAERIERYARSMLHNSLVKAQYDPIVEQAKAEAEAKGEKPEIAHSVYASIDWQVRDDLKDNWDQYEPEYSKIVEKLSEQIPPEYTMDDLVTKWNAPEDENED